ncbi:MAG: hypothetical protein R3D57_02465 [Hyphomicrobiaceae bacterium]
MLRHGNRLVGLVLAFSGAIALSVDAHAAMRYCKSAVSGEGTAASEIEAKKQAMADWKAKSVDAGIEHPAWRIAASKSLGCEAGADGVYICNAIAEPCTISQVPKP